MSREKKMIHEQIIPGLSEEIIKTYAQDETIYARGTSYYDEGAVRQIIRSDNIIQAHVSGNQRQSYRIRLQFNEHGIISSHCTCPYEGHVCKHIVATLLECMYNQKNVLEFKSIINSLSSLNGEQLSKLLEKLIVHNPELYYLLLIEIDELTKKQLTVGCNIDPEPYKQAVRLAFHNARSGYFQSFTWNGDTIIDQHLQFIEKIERFLSHNDSINALIILETITTEYVDACDNFIDIYDEDGEITAEIDDIFYTLIAAWHNMVQIAHLSSKDKAHIIHLITKWQKQLDRCKSDFVHDASIDFTPVLQALEHR